MEEKVLELPCVTVTYIADKLLGKIEWHGNVTFEEYKMAFMTLLEIAKAGRPVTRFLSDVRKQGIIPPNSRKWFEAEMVPAAVSNGLQRAVVISDANVFKRYYLNLILAVVNKFNLPFKIFNDEDKAMEFLMEG